ncbi:zinc-binding dehydrogenase [Streptomyces sp. HNM1019]|uniref:zinc-binding dehydrogenase n=1 Tax=Streptomyces sp. HNM1019 TaxID=3424717 RepID=UPI003D786FDB
MIRSHAAVLHRPGEPLRVETIEVAPPAVGEALVEIVASGLCHTDTTTFDGDNPSCRYPAVLGHEGAGRVVEVGPEVAALRPGDHVIPLYGPECGTCGMCRSGRTNLCWTIKATRDRGVMPDGTSRFRLGGETVHHFMGTSTFSRYTVVPEIALARIRPDAPLESVCLLGCGVTTGVGAALDDVREGDTAVVFGLGGIGTNVVQGARIAGAKRIIGVDTVAAKRPLAERFGMTDFVDASAVEDVVDAVRDLSGGGADVAFECTGIVPVMRQAVDSCTVGWGTCVLLGVEPTGSELSFPPVLARYGRTIKGSYFGGVKGRSGIGRFVDLYVEGVLDIDSQITHRAPLTDINAGFDRMARGEGVRTVVTLG